MGLKRQTENKTQIWKSGGGGILWQVEWHREDGSRLLNKVLESKPIGEVFTAIMVEETRLSLRKGDERRQYQVKEPFVDK
jgi:hypothetical protein